MSAPDRREMLDRADKALSIRRQCALLCVAPGVVHTGREKAGTHAADRRIVHGLSFLWFAADDAATALGGARHQPQARAADHASHGHCGAGPSRTRRNPRRDTRFIPSLARSENRTAQSRVVRRHHLHSDWPGFPLSLVRALMDWASRAVLSWRLLNTMDASFCVEALEEALAKYGKPEIFNTDQAASSPAWTSPVCCSKLESKFRWTDADAGWTMSSSSAFGGP